MSDAENLNAAVAAGVLASEERFAELLRSIVEVARAIFGAKASSIFLLDEEADELVFAAVAGEGEQSLVGNRMPSSTGIAGWVLSSRTPLVLARHSGEHELVGLLVEEEDRRGPRREDRPRDLDDRAEERGEARLGRHHARCDGGTKSLLVHGLPPPTFDAIR